MNRQSRYVQGNTARNIDVARAIQEAPTHETLRRINSESKKNNKMHMGFIYVLFLAGALVILGSVLISYVKLQSEITSSVKRISRYEQELNNLTLANDDEYSKINNAVDLEEVRRVAVEELGMVYADENQIVSYEREQSDYVRQLQDIPN